MRSVFLSGVLAIVLLSAPASAGTVDGHFVCNRDIVRTQEIIELAPDQLKLREPSAARRAASIILNAGPTLAGNASALAAWNDAVDLWESVLGNNITITINGDLADLPPNVLGSTSSPSYSGAGFNSVRSRIVGTASPDEGIVASLPLVSQISVTLPPSGFAFGNDISAPRSLLNAIGFNVDGLNGNIDATIEFSTDFLPSFDFDPTDGIPPGKLDFFAIVVHEIGHALGFTSTVDFVDFCESNPRHPACVGTVTVNPSALDLFRIIPGQGGNFTFTERILTAGADVPAQTFYDGVVERRLSTGSFNGDGRQASHWRADEISGTTIGIMDPTIGSGQLGKLTNSDVRAFGLIGWDVNFLADCNDNDIGDQFDIWAGDEEDTNLNGIPDSCEATDTTPAPRNAQVVIAPNPFNPRTEIKLTLAEGARSKVSIYDLAGRHIDTLADRSFGAGEHSVIWEGKDAGGRGVSSGVYLVLVNIDGDVQQHKVALVR